MADILFIKPSNASFVENDRKILSKYFTIKCRRFHFTPFLRLLYNEIALSVWLVVHGIKAKVFYIWFADYHSIIPVILAKMMRKKSVIVVGGYDVANIPEFNYGAHLWRFRSFYIKHSFNLASLLLPVSRHTQEALVQYAPKTPVQLLYNGIDCSLFFRDPRIKKQKKILTVCGADNVRSVLIKGIDLFLATARLMPHVPFTIVGLQGEARDYVENQAPGANVRLVGYTNQDELLRYYNEAQIYCQFSHHESFGVALSEAMLCECIPVVTANGALPELVDDVGYVLNARSPELAVQCIHEALDNYDQLKEKVRNHIIQHYSLKRREEELLNILNSLFKKRF